MAVNRFPRRPCPIHPQVLGRGRGALRIFRLRAVARLDGREHPVSNRVARRARLGAYEFVPAVTTTTTSTTSTTHATTTTSTTTTTTTTRPTTTTTSSTTTTHLPATTTSSTTHTTTTRATD